MSLIDDLKRDEGFRTHPYRCTAGKLTIGYGRNLDDVGISPGEGEYLLMNDIRAAEADLLRTVPFARQLSPRRYDALVNMVFNLGISRFRGFRNMLTAIERGDYHRAADEMLNSLWARQVGRRAQRLAQDMRDG